MGTLIEGAVRLILYLGRFLNSGIRALSSRKWPRIEATVTNDPEMRDGILIRTIEFAYSCRVGGELYKGLHEEPCFLSEPEYAGRFANGRLFVVRVKPGEPAVSVVRDRDQSDCIHKAPRKN